MASIDDHAAELEPGTLVGAYHVERRLGKGATGTIYQALEPTIGKHVAVKVLRRALAGQGSALERFRREGLAANRVRHPAIVEVFAIGALSDGRPYLVMPLLEGKTLRDEIDEHQRLPPGRAWAIAREVATGLAAAHAAGIVHRDLKPDNIFLEQVPGQPERVRILDFGLAKFLAAEPCGASLTETGAVVGTPAYMAPEQWFNADVSAATDQYALGAVLFEMLVGGPPFRAEQLTSVLQMHLHDRPPALAARGASVPPAVETLVLCALAKAATDRFASMQDFIRAGDAAFGIDRPLASPSPAPTPQPMGQRAGVLRRFMNLHGALLVLGAGGLLTVGYTGPGRHDPRHWAWIAGSFFAYLHLGLFLLANLALLLLARRSARAATGTGWAWACCLAPALSGALGTTGGWNMVLLRVAGVTSTERFAWVSLGMYEANASRFMGFAMSSILCFGASLLLGGIGPLQLRRERESIIALTSLLVVAALAIVARVPSGALVATAGALAIAVGLISNGRDETELARALARALGLVLAVAVAFARVEAREGYLWHVDANPTRQLRAAELIAASGERTATVLIALATLALLATVETVRLRRLLKRRALTRPRWRGWALVGMLAAAIGLDAGLYARMLARRDGYRLALATRFALLGRLDPPTGERLPTDRFRPSDAPALQITRDLVAVNSEPLARLAATELESRLRQRLTDVVASEAARTGAAARADLLVTIDREVPYRTVSRVLRLAHEAGVQKLELLLARSPAPALPASAPAEASYLVPSDFVALPAELAEQGFSADAAEPFGKTTVKLIDLVLADRKTASARIAVPRR